MKTFSSVDLLFLHKELQTLENSRIESFYFENNIFYLKVFSKGLGHKFLTFKIGSHIYISESKVETTHPNPFITYLRKYLKNGFIETVEVIEGERILKLIVSKKKDEGFVKYQLYIEIFSPGNVILCDNEGTILNSLTKKNFKDRIVKNKETYQLPPSKNITLQRLDYLESEIKNSDLVLVKFLALKFGMGSKYAEELVTRMNISKDTPIQEVGSNLIVNTIKSFLEEKREAYVKEGNEDFFPLRFNQDKLEKVSSFNEAIKMHYETHQIVIDPKEKEFEKEFKKLQNRLKKQEQQLLQVEKDYDKFNSYGNIIYENFTELEELLNTLNSAAKEKGWEYVQNIIKNSENASLKKIKKLDYKNNKIIVEL